MNKTLLVTGGAGFIGSCFVLQALQEFKEPVVVLDALTYAGSRENLVDVSANSDFRFVQGDICDESLLEQLIPEIKPKAILHFAAETHVDRSILGPEAFIRTNVFGTFRLLQAANRYYASLERENKKDFRFLHISTDEVYGSLSPKDPAFTETTPYSPNSPYSASKASSDHLVRAYQHTYGLPTLTTNCSNNYGPRQFPEKLIPLMILNALAGKPLPVYGDGLNVRDWLYVGDHCLGIRAVLERGQIGETYNIGGEQELSNIALVRQLCAILDDLVPKAESYAKQITYVKDRPGHDRRYAMNIDKVQKALGWKPLETLETGLRKTIQWYLANTAWIKHITSGTYAEWVGTQYAELDGGR